MSLQVLQLVKHIHQLKLTARTGWNMEFPPGHRFKTRCVSEAESVADHSYSLAMYALTVAIALNLDVEKMVTMALVHDAPELITTDIVTATLDGDEKGRVQLDKRQREESAARQLFLSHGQLGARCYELWLEYESQTSEEARILRQLDKIECAVQAVLYAQQGHQLDASEFITNAEKEVTHPFLVRMLDELRQQWQD